MVVMSIGSPGTFTPYIDTTPSVPFMVLSTSSLLFFFSARLGSGLLQCDFVSLDDS